MTSDEQLELFRDYRETLGKLSRVCGMFGAHAYEPIEVIEAKLLKTLGKTTPRTPELPAWEQPPAP